MGEPQVYQWTMGNVPDHLLVLNDLRESYGRDGLLETGCDSNPIVQFERWFQDAHDAGIRDANAMTLATADAAGRPSARIVLLKEVSEAGFVWYTNYTSRKAEDLTANPAAALVFYWRELERQVRVEGRVDRVSRQQSEAYFRSRPRGSRLGALVSRQSKRAESREEIDSSLHALEQQFGDAAEIPLPDAWGGYRLAPDVIEFWQGRPNRLHDRLLYRRAGETWRLERLWP